MHKYINPFIFIFILVFSFKISAEELQCTRDDVIGSWTSYSIDFGVSDHIEYQEQINILYLHTDSIADQFLVSFSGSFSLALNPWQGECIGDQYVLMGEIESHNSIHSVQAVRNPSAPTTDQCSLERCESTCVADLLAECSISKDLPGRKLTFMFLPGHAANNGEGEIRLVAQEIHCDAHDCNHPGEYHSHDPD